MTERFRRLAAGGGLALLLAGGTAFIAAVLRHRLAAPVAPVEPAGVPAAPETVPPPAARRQTPTRVLPPSTLPNWPPPATRSVQPPATSRTVPPPVASAPRQTRVAPAGTFPDYALHTIVACNRGTELVIVAFGYRSGSTWTATGWFQVPAARCSPPFVGLGGAVYAHATTGRQHWRPAGDSTRFCVDPGAMFTLSRLSCPQGRSDRVFRTFGRLVVGPARNFTWTIPAFDAGSARQRTSGETGNSGSEAVATAADAEEARTILRESYTQPAEYGGGASGTFAHVQSLYVEPWHRRANSARTFLILGEPARVRQTNWVSTAVHERFEESFQMAGVRGADRVAFVVVDCSREQYSFRRLDLYDRTDQTSRPTRRKSIPLATNPEQWSSPAGGTAGLLLIRRVC